MPRAYSSDLRERVLAGCEAGLSHAAAARRYRLSERTVYRWRHEARHEGWHHAKPAAGGRRPVVAGTEGVLHELVAGASDATLAEQVGVYAARTGRELSASTLCRAFRRARADVQKKTLRAHEREREDVQEERAAYAEPMRGLDPNRLVFVDEAGAATDLTRTHARAPRGRRAYGRRRPAAGVGSRCSAPRPPTASRRR